VKGSVFKSVNTIFQVRFGKDLSFGLEMVDYSKSTFFFFLVVLGFELRALYLLGGCSTT
jgi:hypothetical protein